MKRLVFLGLFALTGCLGNSSRNNELVGQVKKVMHNTPLVCIDYDDVDVSLGVIRNGTGSMSQQDMWLYIPNKADYLTLKDAAEKGNPVKITYDVARFHWCVEEHTVTRVELGQ